VASLSQGRTAAAQCGLFTHKSVPVIFEPPCILMPEDGQKYGRNTQNIVLNIINLLALAEIYNLLPVR